MEWGFIMMLAFTIPIAIWFGIDQYRVKKSRKGK